MADGPRPEKGDTAQAVGWYLRLHWHNANNQTGTLDLALPGSVLLGSAEECEIRLGDAPAVAAVLLAESSGLLLRRLHSEWPVRLADESSQALAPAQASSSKQLFVFPPCRVRIGPVEIEAEWVRPTAVSSDTSTAPDNQATTSASFLPPIPTAWPRSVLEAVHWLHEQQRQFEHERQHWRSEAERELAELTQRAETLQRQQQALNLAQQKLQEARQALEADRQTLLDEQNRLQQQQERLSELQQELHRQRQRIDALYQRRRDHLRALRESVRRAASKVQREKRRLAEELESLRQQRQTLSQQLEELQTASEQLRRDREQLDQERRLVAEWHAELEQELHTRQQQLNALERQLQEKQQQLAADVERVHQDALRLERVRSDLVAQQQHLDQRARQLDQLAQRLAAQEQRQSAQEAALKQREAQAQSLAQELAEREQLLAQRELRVRQQEGLLEQHQALFAAARSRLDRLRTELRQREEQLLAERRRLDEHEQSLAAASKRLNEEMLAFKREQADWHRRWAIVEARCRELDSAQAELDQNKQRLSDWQRQLEHKDAELEEQSIAQTQAGALVACLARHYAHKHRRLRRQLRALVKRQAELNEQAQALTQQQEQIRHHEQTLAEQLREVQSQQQQLQAERQILDQERKTLTEQKQSWEGQRQSWESQLAEREQTLQQREHALAEQLEDLVRRGRELRQQQEELTRQQQELRAEQARWEQQRGEWEQAVRSWQQQLPILADQAREWLQKLAQARTVLREQLDELHAYAREVRTAREHAWHELHEYAQRLRQQEQALALAQTEHRHALATFRQQLSEWRAQVQEWKSALAHNESRLAQKQAELEQKAAQLQQTSTRLAQEAEHLAEARRVVSAHQSELERQLLDLQSWYRRKLRELAGKKLLTISEESESPALPAAPPADLELAEQLLAAEVIDRPTLAALLADARRRRCSLRDLLVDSEYLSPFQLEMIENHRLEALLAGRLRILDRLRVTPLETIYRVFDPETGQEGLLRHLAPAVDETRWQEYLDSFRRALAIKHPNLARTQEVFSWQGSPAVLVEWIDGVPGPEWQEFASVPAVWLRLLHQAASGLNAAHQAGLTHGHLHTGRLLLTENALLKVCGIGEPLWLFPEAASEGPADLYLADIRSLGRIARSWLTSGPHWQRDADKIYRLICERLLGQAEPAYSSLADLIADLEHLLAEHGQDGLPAWEHLLVFLRERLHPHTLPLARSA